MVFVVPAGWETKRDTRKILPPPPVWGVHYTQHTVSPRGGGRPVIFSLSSTPHSFLSCLFSYSLSTQISKDGDSFTVPLEVAKMSELVKSMMDGTFMCVCVCVCVGILLFGVETPPPYPFFYSLIQRMRKKKKMGLPLKFLYPMSKVKSYKR
jgi:hypothetical protein